MPDSKPASLLFVSANLTKFLEFSTLLDIQNLEMAEAELPEYQHDNLESIVRHKISLAQRMFKNQAFFVEHSGLELDAWQGMPGGLTRVFMDKIGPAGICKMLVGFEADKRTATAVSIIGLYSPQTGIRIFRGNAYGKIADSPRASLDHPWDWDEIFIPSIGDNSMTYSEMGLRRKNEISMRRRAADELAEYCRNTLPFQRFTQQLKIDKAIITEAEQLVVKGETERAIKRLSDAAQDQATSAGRQNIMLIANQYNRWKKDQTLGLISQEESRLRYNRITHSLVSFLATVK